MRRNIAAIQAPFVMLSAMLNPDFAAAGTAFSLLYTAGGDYEPAFGLGIYSIKQGAAGYYFNGLTTVQDREPHYDSLNVDSFGDPVTDRFQDLTLLNFGMTRSLGGGIAAYAGLGYGWATGVAEKNDPTRILSSDGEYYVDDPANDESGANANIGVLVNAGAVSLDISYHSFAESIHVGIGSTF